jgi:hypothetical protein
MKNKVSPEVEVQAMKMAKGTKQIKQTKEQTKLIARGIEKGIAEYKKQQSKKSREMDKLRKQQIKQQDKQSAETAQLSPTDTSMKFLPWLLLAFSWIVFFIYIVL